MRLSITAAFAAAGLAATGILAGCGSGASSSSFAPAAPSQQSITEPGPNARPKRGVTNYYLLTLDSLGGSLSFAINVNDAGQASGTSLLNTGAIFHAQIWENPPHTIDLGTLGGPNSAIFQYNHGGPGRFVGWSETSHTDPYDENFCGFGTSHTCLGFIWQHGKMKALPLLGGNNDNANDENWRGQIVGASETTKDSSCIAPRVYDFLGVIWQPNGKITTLPPYSGDTVSYAYTISQSGRLAVGQSGTCASAANHAVLWKNASSPINLGTLGGTVNVALDVNDLGQVIGNSNLSGDTVTHAFLWQKGTLKDLGTLPGDESSFAGGINDEGQIVGESCDASGNCRGFLWQNGTITDLNVFIPPSKDVNVLFGANINDWGQIVGATVNAQNVEQGILLTPYWKSHVAPKRISTSKKILPHTRSKFWDLRKIKMPR
jgi:probable HAF family extracellular repeat protein